MWPDLILCLLTLTLVFIPVERWQSLRQHRVQKLIDRQGLTRRRPL